MNILNHRATTEMLNKKLGKSRKSKVEISWNTKICSVDRKEINKKGEKD